MKRNHRNPSFAIICAIGMLVGGCAMEPKNAENSMSDEDGTADNSTDGQSLAQTETIAIAMIDFPEGPVPTARFPGKFLVRRSCLKFDTGSELYTPIFRKDDSVSVTESGLTRNSKNIAMSSDVTVNGGEYGSRPTGTVFRPDSVSDCGNDNYLLIVGIVS